MTTLSHPGQLRHTTFDTLLRLAAQTEVVGPPPMAGAVLDGTYELIEPIARGGMATVYRAHDRALGREVAIKLPRVHRGSRLVEMLEREAHITARLSHPNIVVLHGVGHHRGLPYAVLELLRGETLADRLARRGAIAVGEAVAILDAVLRALGHAHAHGVVHRDVTPRNVFLGEDGRIKLLDFGVAIDRERTAGTITRGAGTRGYMPPEHDADTDPRGDLWAAGVLFVECVTGRRPDRGAAAVPRSVPRWVRRIVAQARAHERDRRPATAAEMRRALAAPRRRWVPGQVAITALLVAATLAEQPRHADVELAPDQVHDAVVVRRRDPELVDQGPPRDLGQVLAGRGEPARGGGAVHAVQHALLEQVALAHRQGRDRLTERDPELGFVQPALVLQRRVGGGIGERVGDMLGAVEAAPALDPDRGAQAGDPQPAVQRAEPAVLRQAGAVAGQQLDPDPLHGLGDDLGCDAVLAELAGELGEVARVELAARRGVDGEARERQVQLGRSPRAQRCHRIDVRRDTLAEVRREADPVDREPGPRRGGGLDCLVERAGQAVRRLAVRATLRGQECAANVVAAG
jgi:serine/threonine-protein kinase